MNNQTNPNTVLDFWFKDGMQEKWFMGGDAFDAEIREHFADLHAQASQGDLKNWEDTWQGRLALILVLDQFSRNLYRGKAQAFATDAEALRIAKFAIEQGDDLFLKQHKPDPWRAFLYLPFMHSEDLADQQRCVELFETNGPEQNLSFAKDHLSVIQRFGRFPGRNKALGRESSAEELAFLQDDAPAWSK